MNFYVIINVVHSSRGMLLFTNPAWPNLIFEEDVAVPLILLICQQVCIKLVSTVVLGIGNIVTVCSNQTYIIVVCVVYQGLFFVNYITGTCI